VNQPDCSYLPRLWKPIDSATTGFGQGAMAVTPLQLVAGLERLPTMVNGSQPHLIKRIYDPVTA